MKMKKIASVVSAGVMAMGIGASLAPASVAFADSPYCGTPGINYSGAEFRTFNQNRYHYGLYEVCMKPAKSDGIVSSFFTYTGPYDEPKTQWDEIDIEFLGKDTAKVQFNYYVDSKGGHEYLYDLGFDASEDFHVYAFD